jgi:hypothetical protein
MRCRATRGSTSRSSTWVHPEHLDDVLVGYRAGADREIVRAWGHGVA